MKIVRVKLDGFNMALIASWPGPGYNTISRLRTHTKATTATPIRRGNSNHGRYHKYNHKSSFLIGKEAYSEAGKAEWVIYLDNMKDRS